MTMNGGHELPKTLRIEASRNYESLQELAQRRTGVERKMLPDFGKRPAKTVGFPCVHGHHLSRLAKGAVSENVNSGFTNGNSTEVPETSN